MHLVLELAADLGTSAREELLDLAHVGGIVDGVYLPAADARPAPDVIVEAGSAVLAQNQVGDRHVVGVTLEVAAGALPLRAAGDADGHRLAQGVDGLARGVGVRVRAEVAGSLAVPLARVLDRREGVVLGDGDVGVALVVLEVDVEVGVVLGDEVALQHQRLVLGAHDHIVEATDHLHHQGDLGTVVRQVDVLEHARAQVLGLAHVDDLPPAVLPEVAARLRGNLGHLLGDARHAQLLRARGGEAEVGPSG